MTGPRWIVVVVSWFFLASGWATAEEPKPLNILILYADDWRHDTLGCAGHPVVQTPHLDALAQEGIRFTRACVTTSICGVSRASLLTGQWMSRHGNEAFAMFKTPWAETFPALLRANGYWVGHVGKWHCGAFPKDQFDFGRAYAGQHWLSRNKGEPVHVTEWNERDAREFLQHRPQDRPFCLQVSFFAPHAEDAHPQQYRPQPHSEKLYSDVTIPVPATATQEALQRLPPFLQKPENEGRKRWTWRFDTPEKYQTMMKNYFRLCTEVDAACGRILAELKKQGVLEQTLVIFTTDNGYFHGERQLADKWYPYEESIRVPLIVRDPRLPQAKRGTTNDEFVLNVDLAPTILHAANLRPPASMQGRDFSVLYRNARVEPPWRSAFFYEHATITNKNRIPSSQALVRKDFKYIYWPEFRYEELFDRTSDPHEQNNRIADPTLAQRLAELKKQFDELRAAAR
ncbi:MAG: sulfatase [Gemmataceae bacterium]|nr:sulfatase [Gemmataceae bacterium]